MFALSIIFYRLLLDISYIVFVNPVYEYSGFELDISLFNYLISWIITILLIPFTRSKIKEIADYAILFLFLLVILPICSIYALDLSRPWQPMAISIFSMLLIVFFVRVKLLSFKQIPVMKNGFLYALLICVSGVIYTLINYSISGVTLNFDITRVYDFRESNALLTNSGIRVYMNIWAYKVFNIALICLCLFYRRFFLLGILILIQIYFYAANAHKLVLFLPILCLSCWYYFRKSNSLTFFPKLLNYLLLLSLAIVTIYEYYYAGTLLIRRLFFVPANNSYAYYEFFSNNEYNYWSDSFLNPFLESQYPNNVANTIGQFLGQDNMAANNGFISSGYANAGITGVIIYSILLAFILRFVNYLIHNKLQIWLPLAILIVPISNTILNSDLLTTLLTHGLGVAIIIVYLITSKQKKLLH